VWAGRGDDEIAVRGPGSVIDCGPGTDKVTVQDFYSLATQTPRTMGCEQIIDRR
jgi:hypothetical protein